MSIDPNRNCCLFFSDLHGIIGRHWQQCSSKFNHSGSLFPVHFNARPDSPGFSLGSDVEDDQDLRSKTTIKNSGPGPDIPLFISKSP